MTESQKAVINRIFMNDNTSSIRYAQVSDDGVILMKIIDVAGYVSNRLLHIDGSKESTSLEMF